MSSHKKSIFVAVGAAAAAGFVVGAGVYFFTKGKHTPTNDDEDAFNITADGAPGVKVNLKEGTSVLKETNITSQVGKSDSAGQKGKKPLDAALAENELLTEALNEIGMDAPAERAKTLVTSAGKSNDKGTKEDRKEFPNLGLSMAVPKGWEIREDLSPFPLVAVLTVWNQDLVIEDDHQRIGAVPTILLSVEDVRGDNDDLAEYKDRCKDATVNQLLMMTGGAIEPKVTKDSPVQDGPFRHVVEFTQSLPPFYDIVVFNLLEVRNCIAYNFQIMCSPSVLPQYKSMFMEMARSVRIVGNLSTAIGYVELHTGSLKIDIDTNWSWDYPGKNNALATFTTSSMSKKEEISLYAEGTVPTTTYKPQEEKNMDGVHIVSAFDGSQQQKTLTYNGYVLVVKPLQKSISYLIEEELIVILKSVTPSTEKSNPKKSGTFINKEHGYLVDVVRGGRLVASRIGGYQVVYAPCGVAETMDEEQPPTVTIRIGYPETDPECMSSLDEWEEQIKEKTEGDIKEITRTTITGERCLTVVSQNMDEIAPGQRMEVCTKLFIFVRNGKTTLIRWSSAVGLWKKFERDMNAFVDSFRFI
ncbi:putative dynamin-like protein [Trypanosoma theileri]|uniref:Putative dynamin-like protein n=1 Tax=Trypanosoma theileri TaxID=67003 RepID=A0A1X0NI07_9TRYP|nr:putative dynamin-like protein [Trypanosoma theileri]ORC84287.1 putative dynamin-like protein [Trypanosoma theileri]